MVIPPLSRWASVRLPLPRFQSPLTEPGVPISGTGLSSGIMRLAHGPPGQGRDRAGEPADRGRCTTAVVPPASSPMRRRACSRLDDIEPIEFDSFASACDALRTLGHQGGVLGRATPAGLRPSRIPPHLRPLPSAGITRLPRYCGPLRHPAGPACPSRGSGWRVPATDRASRVATASLFHACRRHYPGGADRCARRSLPGRWQPSPLFGRVGLRIARFEACSTFTRVAARMVAEPPRAARCTGVLQSKSLPPSTAPIATGWSDSCRAGFPLCQHH